MVARPVPTDELQRFWDAYHACGCNLAATAEAINKPRATLQHWRTLAQKLRLQPNIPPSNEPALREIIENLRRENDDLKHLLSRASKPHFTIRQEGARGERIRLLCIGDAHDSPNIPDKSRFEHIGKYIDQEKPDVVVQIGDFATLDSLNGHVPNETYSGKAKPTFIADMVSFNEALQAMQTNHKPEKHVTLGNHERRLYLFEDRAPEAYGMMQAELDSVLSRNGWTYSPYGQIHMYGGVGFTHAALNRLGKTYGGKNAEATIANEAMHDLVIGHSHVERVHRAPKLGIGNPYVQIINAGCALPDGYIEDYAQHALTGWSWGITELTIQHGHVQDRKWIPMGSLREMFAHAA